MATKTTNYNLTKPSYSEDADISVINSNMDIIDSKMKEIEDKAGTGGGGSSVSWNQIQTTGSKIAEVTIDGATTEVYAPSESGGGGGEYDSSVELTQAEYDALPDTKLTDNKNYFIKDGKGSGSGSGYSETLLYENTDRTKALGTYNLSSSIRGYDMIAIEVNRNPTVQWNLEHCNYLQGSIMENLIGGSYVGNSGNDETNKGIWLLGPESSNAIISFPTEDTFKLDYTTSLWVKRIYGIKY